MTPRTALCVVLFMLPIHVGHAASPPKEGFSTGGVIEVRLTEAKLRGLMDENSLSLPQLRVYDRDGRLLRDFGNGFKPADFETELQKLVRSPVTSPNEKVTLPNELAVVMTGDRKALGDLSKVDLTFVEYWAEWCAPCHMQFDLLVKFLNSHQEVQARLIHVDADPAKIGIELRKIH